MSIPATAIKVVVKGIAGTEIYLWSEGSKTYAKAFTGKASKPSFYYSYSSEQRREESIKKWIDGLFSAQKRKTEWKQELNKDHDVKEGDVFRSSWGYDQTNVDYFQVTKVIGKMVEVRKIAQERIDTGDMCGQCVPSLNVFIGLPMRKKVTRGDTIKIEHNYAYLEKPELVHGVKVYKGTYFSSYA
jgi:hypothetical protein